MDREASANFAAQREDRTYCPQIGFGDGDPPLAHCKAKGRGTYHFQVSSPGLQNDPLRPATAAIPTLVALWLMRPSTALIISDPLSSTSSLPKSNPALCCKLFYDGNQILSTLYLKSVNMLTMAEATGRVNLLNQLLSTAKRFEASGRRMRNPDKR